MGHLSSDSIVIVSKFVSTHLEVLNFLSNEFVDLFVMSSIVSHGFGKLHGLPSSFDFDVTSECLEFINVFGSVVSFYREQLYIEILLVVLLQERDQEGASFQYARLKDSVEESLVVVLSAQELLGSHSFFTLLG